MAKTQLADFPNNYVVLDFETTGLNGWTDAITQIGVIRIRERKRVAEFSTYVNPQRPIPNEVKKITGMSDRKVRNAPIIAVILPRLLDFIGDDIIVCHNAEFDAEFLRAACEKILKEKRFFDTRCTLEINRELSPNMKSHRLDYLTEKYNFINKGREHEALYDCRCTHDLFEHQRKRVAAKEAKAAENKALKTQAKTMGITVKELREQQSKGRGCGCMISFIFLCTIPIGGAVAIIKLLT